MVRIVQQICFECEQPIVRACERCEQWNTRVRNFYAGEPDREFAAILDNFKPVQHA